MYNEREERWGNIKTYFRNTVPYFIDFAVGIGMSLVMALLFGIPFTFFRDINMNIVRFVIGMPGICYALYRRCFRLYYHRNSCTYSFSWKKSAKHIAFAFVWQAFFVILVGSHAVYVTGPTYWITDVLFPNAFRSDMGGHFLHEGHDWLLMFLADFLIYGPVMVFGEYIGSREHKKDYQIEKMENEV